MDHFTVVFLHELLPLLTAKDILNFDRAMTTHCYRSVWLSGLQTSGPALINAGKDAICTSGVQWLAEKGIALGSITLSGDCNSANDIIESIQLVAKSFPQLEDISILKSEALLDNAIHALATSCSKLKRVKFRCSCSCFSSKAISEIVDLCKNIECIDLGHWHYIRNPKILTLAWHRPDIIYLNFEGSKLSF